MDKKSPVRNIFSVIIGVLLGTGPFIWNILGANSKSVDAAGCV